MTRCRPRICIPKLTLAVEQVRKTHPMWGKDKLAPLLWKQGFDGSVSKVGRILKKLVARGAILAVPNLRKRSKHAPRKHKRLYAVRLPRKLKPEKPGQIVQVDTVHIVSEQNRAKALTLPLWQWINVARRWVAVATLGEHQMSADHNYELPQPDRSAAKIVPRTNRQAHTQRQIV